MSLKKYFKFVDIKTSILSLYAYALGAAFIFYYLGNWNWQNALVFFFAEMIQDNMVTGINNVMDYRHAKTEQTRKQNVMEKENISYQMKENECPLRRFVHQIFCSPSLEGPFLKEEYTSLL